MTTKAGEEPAPPSHRPSSWRSRFASPIAVLLIGAVVPASAQEPGIPAIGTPMGVWAPGRIEGRFARVTATSLILEANDGQTIEVPLFAVREWRVADGDRGHALAGGLLGLAGAVVTGSELGAVVGTGLGALIGSQIRTPWLRRRSLRPIRPTPLPGTLIRLRSDDERRGGTVLVWSPDSVVLKSGDRIHSFGRPNVRSVEWPVGRGSWGPPGARIGASVGATAGVLLGLLIDSECKSSDHFFCGSGSGSGTSGYALGLGVGGGAALGLAGYAIGSAFPRTRWEGEATTSARLSAIPLVSPRRIGLAAVVRF